MFGFLLLLSQQSLSFDEDLWCLIDSDVVPCPSILITTSNSPPTDQFSSPQQSFGDQMEEMCIIHNSMIVPCPSTLSSVSNSFTTDE